MTGTLDGKRVALTGNPEGLTREEFKQKIQEAGGEYVLRLEDGLDFLVVGESALAARVEKARSLGAVVESWADFTVRLSPSSAPLLAEPAVPLATAEFPRGGASLELLEGSLRVLDVLLPRRAQRGPLTPALEGFSHYTLDACTLAMLRFVASAAVLRHPCLLEGETATSKTSAILYLAALTGHEVVRLNLNGQTDTSELVGRYVPNEQALSLSPDALRKHLDLLESETRIILRQAQTENRALSEVETQQIIANEGMSPPAWRFQEGLLPQAMRHGWWVILDEMNLAEPQVLERLNPVLEREPGLVLTEGSGTRFGRGGDVPVHPDFRLFATINPAEYQGRAVLSPAFKDRWTSTWQADAPGEVEYRQFLEHAVYGAQPSVLLDGIHYEAPAASSGGYEPLASIPGMKGFLARVATLHAAMVESSTARDGRAAALGSSRRERYVFSRRALLAILDTLRDLRLWDQGRGGAVGLAEAPERVAMEALERAYLWRIRGAEDRARVTALLRSLGLSREQWLYRFEEEPPPA